MYIKIILKFSALFAFWQKKMNNKIFKKFFKKALDEKMQAPYIMFICSII